MEPIQEKQKWIYPNPPVGPGEGGPEAFPIRLTVNEEPLHPDAIDHGLLYAFRVSVWYRDPSRPIGHDDKLSVRWAQKEKTINLKQFGEALVTLGQELVKEDRP